MLSKAEIMLRVMSERGFLRTSRSKSEFAPGLVVLRAVRMLQSAPCPSLIFGSRLVQNSCMSTFSNDSGEMNDVQVLLRSQVCCNRQDLHVDRYHLRHIQQMGVRWQHRCQK